VPHTAPFGGGGGGPAWGSAIVTVPWNCYEFYGDITFLEEHYESMKAWLAYLDTRTDERGVIVREEPGGWCLGDWCTPGRELPDVELVNTCYYYHCADLVSKAAGKLGCVEDQKRYALLAQKIAGVVNSVFYNPLTHDYASGARGENEIPLAFGIVPGDERENVLQRIDSRLEELDYHFDTGIIGTPLLLDVLSDNGRVESAFKVLSQKEGVGYGYLMDERNSTLWEQWDGVNSRCHPMFGTVVAWMYRVIGGIDIPSSDMASGKIVIRPVPCGDITSASCSLETVYGRVSVDWRLRGRSLKAVIEIPYGLDGEVILGESRFPARSGRHSYTGKIR